MEADAFVRRGGPAARVRAGAAPRPPALWLSLSRARAKRTFSPKKKPRTAIIDTRPCMSSASRRSFTEEMVLQFFESPSGSKKPSGAEMPASPCMNSLGVGGGGGGGGGGSSGAASPAAALPATRPLLAGAQPHRGVRGALPAALPPETLIFITAILPLPRLGRARDPHNHHHHCRVTKSTLCGHDRFALLQRYPAVFRGRWCAGGCSEWSSASSGLLWPSRRSRRARERPQSATHEPTHRAQTC